MESNYYQISKTISTQWCDFKNGIIKVEELNEKLFVNVLNILSTNKWNTTSHNSYIPANQLPYTYSNATDQKIQNKLPWYNLKDLTIPPINPPSPWNDTIDFIQNPFNSESDSENKSSETEFFLDQNLLFKDIENKCTALPCEKNDWNESSIISKNTISSTQTSSIANIHLCNGDNKSVDKPNTCSDIKAENNSKKNVRFYLTKDVYIKYKKGMNKAYLNLIYLLYSSLKDKADQCYGVERLMFIKLFQKMLLLFGVSSKNIYECVLRKLTFIQEEITFQSFLLALEPLLKLKLDDSIIKYKFLLNLISIDYECEDFTFNELRVFTVLSKCKLVYEKNTAEDLEMFWINQYRKKLSKMPTFKKTDWYLELDSFYTHY